MNARTKSILIIATTLFIGIAIGALGAGTLFNQRVETLQALREGGGFVFFIERVVEPVDEAQRQEIRVVLKRAAQEQLELRRSMLDEHRALFAEIRSELDEILTDEQKQKLRTWIEQEMRQGRSPSDRRPPPFMRGRPKGFSPDSTRGRRPRFRERMPIDSVVVE